MSCTWTTPRSSRAAEPKARCTPAALAGVPIDSLASAHNVLLALAEQAATDVGDEELLEGLMFRLTETLGSNVTSAQGWQQLEQALRRSLEAGLAPGDIASLLKGHLQNR